MHSPLTLRSSVVEEFFPLSKGPPSPVVKVIEVGRSGFFGAGRHSPLSASTLFKRGGFPHKKRMRRPLTLPFLKKRNQIHLGKNARRWDESWHSSQLVTGRSHNEPSPPHPMQTRYTRSKKIKNRTYPPLPSNIGFSLYGPIRLYV